MDLIVIETERLRLRHLSAEDAVFIRELVNDPDFLRYIGDKGVRSDADAVAYIRDGPMAGYERFGFGLNAVELKDTGKLIGICGVLKRDALPDVDVGFAFLAAYRSRGYAVEAAAAVITHADKKLGLKRILAITDPDNLGSIRLLEKIGLRFERMIEMTPGDPELRLFAMNL